MLGGWHQGGPPGRGLWASGALPGRVLGWVGTGMGTGHLKSCEVRVALRWVGHPAVVRGLGHSFMQTQEEQPGVGAGLGAHWTSLPAAGLSQTLGFPVRRTCRELLREPGTGEGPWRGQEGPVGLGIGGHGKASACSHSLGRARRAEGCGQG